jgi:mRNA-degrading endonuclease RelE of RelBE toxin-antitoxin system
MFDALENVSKAAHQFLLFEKRNDNSEQQAENVKEEVDEFLVPFRLKIRDFRLFYLIKKKIIFYFLFELAFF